MIAVVAVLLFVGILAVTAYGWRAMPPESRFRSRWGPGVAGYIGKRAALLTWTVLGGLVLLGTLTTSVGWLGVVVLVWILVMEIVSINTTLARRET